MELLCPACARQLSIPQTMPGTALRCPYCATTFQLAPQPGQMPAPAMQPVGHGQPYGGHVPVMQPSPASMLPSFGAAGVQDRPSRVVRRQKSNSGPLLVFAVLGVLAVGAMIGLGMWMVGDKSRTTTGGKPEDVVQQVARQLVAKEVSLPAKVQWAQMGDKTKQLPGGRWVVASYVDVPSRLGDMYLRQKWEADLTEADGKYTLDRLEFDGQVLVARNNVEVPSGRRGPAHDWLNGAGNGGGNQVGGNQGGGPDRSTNWAVDRVAAEIRESVKLRKTLVVWLLDRSQSAGPQRQEFLRNTQSLFADMRPDAASDPQLRMAVVSFGSDVKFELEQPSGKADEVRQAIEGISDDQSGQEQTFNALSMAAQKYQNFRAEKSGYVLFVAVTDEVGDDQSQLDATLATMRQTGITVHTIGVSAPFGRYVGPGQQAAEGGGNDKNAPSKVRQGPESMYLEMIDLASRDNGGEVMDSGFGPFALTRLCQESGGKYFACQDFGVASGSGRMGGWGSSRRAKVSIDPAVMQKYAPDYVSEAEYQQILAGNKACKALHEAAKLPRADVLVNANTSFTKQDEASFKRLLDGAQRDAAKFEPRLITLTDTLKQGESDRAKLTRPRWQAAFDLAIGRAYAARVRTEGYNAMLAKVKTGGNFTKPGANTWVLNESDTIGAGSSFEKMLEQSKMYLNRVVKDHPGTPWAALAESELTVKSGWQWTEQ